MTKQMGNFGSHKLIKFDRWRNFRHFDVTTFENIGVRNYLSILVTTYEFLAFSNPYIVKYHSSVLS